eukprot:5676704-Amphidinium_carterae.1
MGRAPKHSSSSKGISVPLGTRACVLPSPLPADQGQPLSVHSTAHQQRLLPAPAAGLLSANHGKETQADPKASSLKGQVGPTTED